jgi:non-ribosomal peptide synthetase component F
VRDLLALYDARATGTRATLPEPRVRFADFAVWSRRLEGEGRLASDVDHWRAALGDVELGMGLPHDRDEPEKSTFAAGVRGMHLRAGLASEVRSFARARQTTVFAVFLASVAVLLHRVTGRRDVCLGVVVANRGADPALADVAGCFINVLPLRIAVDPGMSAAALLAECHRSLAAGLAHQSAPFELVLRALGRRRGPAGGAALSVNVQQRNYPESWPRSAGGLTIEPFRLHPATHIGEVEFDLQETAAGFIVETIYRAELFTEEAIARLDDGLANGLAWIVRDTDRPVGDAPRPSWPVPRVAAARRAP